MTWTAFNELSFYWTSWTLFEALWIGLLWTSRSRVPGRAVYWIRPARRVRRRACERRVDTLLHKLEQQGVPAQDRPDKEQLVDRWHRMVAGRCASVPLQLVPVLIAVAPILPLRPGPGGSSVTSLWMFAGIAMYGTVSIALMAADERAAAVSDPAGLVTARAALFLEGLLEEPEARRSQESALDAHGKSFRRLCRALRIQARYLPRELPSAVGERVRQDTERMIAALTQANEGYLFSEGPDREAAVGELARLVSGALRHSCRPRDSRDSPVVIGAHLLADVVVPDGTARRCGRATVEPIAKLDRVACGGCGPVHGGGGPARRRSRHGRARPRRSVQRRGRLPASAGGPGEGRRGTVRFGSGPLRGTGCGRRVGTESGTGIRTRHMPQLR
ncbi:hypothetical protein AB0K66_07140 [Streptomyces werraensis]|uniref:hypothetical protein n=1 Tax=Streptomyces werraensis TaxID=68284 RepID=UPI003424C209